MLPRDIKAELFQAYPPQARVLVSTHIVVLQMLPLSFLPSLLREVIDYDFKFPAERESAERELIILSNLTPSDLREWFQKFSQITLSAQFERIDWVNHPAQFAEQQSAYLWSTHQMDAFRQAATEYGDRLRLKVTREADPLPRLGINVIGRGVTSYNAPVFRNLRRHGTYFSNVDPGNGLELLLSEVAKRAKAHPVPYAHWYIDGGQPVEVNPLLTCVSYAALEPVRAALLKKIEQEVAKPGMGPEELRTVLAQLVPSDLGTDKGGDEVLNRLQLRVFTEGSGTQIFSTTFAQWTAREVLRRAQPMTLLVRFAPRQRQRPMNELLSSNNAAIELDPIGSLIDADMGAYYNWVNQQRLPGAEKSSFLVWFEGHGNALLISPSMPRGTESHSPVKLKEVLTWAVA